MSLFKIGGALISVYLAVLFFVPVKQSFSEDVLNDLPPSETPIVLELFTSQGCSSCPPADRLAEILDQRDNLIILSCHVTYWDYIGWKDVFGRLACDHRQQKYAQILSGSNRLYTPQMIINGHQEMVGSYTNQILQAIAQEQRRQEQTQSMKKIVIHKEENRITFDLPDMGYSATYHLRAFLIKSAEIVPIGRGENRNKTINYVQNILEIHDIGAWNGKEKAERFVLPNGLDTDQIIILANENKYGAVHAVGRLKF